MGSTPDTAPAAYLSAMAVVKGLTAGGLRHCVICPGSRSAPITMAMARSKAVKSWPLVDERSAAFFGLGMAKATGEPVAVVCTSGTAAANFMPAVVEAGYSATPLVVLTADRPPELRNTGALQAIDQRRLFGVFAAWYHEIPVPEPDNPMLEKDAFEAASNAIQIAQAKPGPVHLNLPYREPFVPTADAHVSTFEPEAGATGHLAMPSTEPDLSVVEDQLRGARHGLIVAGATRDPKLASLLLRLAERTGFPILADALSGLRATFDGDPLVVDSYDLVVRSPAVRAKMVPDLVLRFGSTPVSKPLLSYLASVPAQISFQTSGLPNDPTSSCCAVFKEAWMPALEKLTEKLPSQPSESDWATSWKRMATASRRAASHVLGAVGELSEPGVVDVLARGLPAGSLFWIGASMPLRDVDAFLSAGPKSARLLANRGVNGIDGVVSSALGAAAALGERVTILLGDLTFFHDLNGLLAAMRYALDATVVLVNNDGGGIFSFLPEAKNADVFETYFATPTAVPFEGIVRAFGGHFENVESANQLSEELKTSMERPGLTVLEVRTDRAENVRIHERIWQAAVEAAEAALAQTVA